MSETPAEKTYRRVPLRGLDRAALERLSEAMKLSLSGEDMEAAQKYFDEAEREPTDVELEVIAQTWSEHCKHRVFGARIAHQVNGRSEFVDGLFSTYIKGVTDEIRAKKPGFVLSAFDDNAGFIRLDDRVAACLKVETHNHPSAIEPYAGANTGLGGVIRDILGAGKGAKPVGSLDVFCFGSPDTKQESIKASDVIHPLGIMRGVVRGVRDYGNRMGIPTVAGAIQFDEAYIYNPLVFCGTAGVIPNGDIAKEVRPGMSIVAVGGRTGRDGLHGATFSSASLTTESHDEDQQAVQIGNPIEEKKVSDFVLEARERGLIECITDCGAGGFSSAAGEMLSETGGEIDLDKAPLKEPGLVAWEVFLSESQERMVLAVLPECLDELKELAGTYETESVVLGQADDSGLLKVYHHGECVCELDCRKLHDAPRKQLTSHHSSPAWGVMPNFRDEDWGESLKDVLGDFAIVSREPVIREYDHEVQGNTFLKPLAGPTGDCPQDGAVFHVDGSAPLLGMGLSLLPEWGKEAPNEMGKACVDECFRQLVLMGSDPDQIALLDNFCMGNPEDADELGQLVECIKGMAEGARAYEAPFVSGKDSFYNYFETDEGPVSIPLTLVISGIGIIPQKEWVTGSSIRSDDSVLFLMGSNQNCLGGSVFSRRRSLGLQRVPDTDFEENRSLYRAYHEATKKGRILSAHDVGEGGLAVTLAEMGFSFRGGIEVTLPTRFGVAVELFGEAPGRFVIEVPAGEVKGLKSDFGNLPLVEIGRTTPSHRELVIEGSEIREDLKQLKTIWQSGLAAYY
ncbi:MAG: phosphoribosylformylglycinamidine synthase subunit PurL [Verrucomicrobiota bacterium]